MPTQYTSVFPSHSRDSLELASLASSTTDPSNEQTPSSRPSLSSSRKASLEHEDPLDSANPAAGGMRPRNYSVSSTFDFAANLFPLSSTAGAGGYAPIGATAAGAQAAGLGGESLEKRKTLTYLNGLSLVVGLIIGSGIFSSPSQVSSNVGSPGAALVVWVVAGILAWTGASSFAELGGAIPLNGGAQVYLAKIFGEMTGFLFAWVAVLVLKPGSAAIISIIMGEYFVRAVVGPDAEMANLWVNKAVALMGL
ncbi:amino acid permease, partial [Candidatus Bathyarchaeota archaeon]|nr:amino acid permease [Candidatus Bathyarchaeota archaeon]